MCSEGALEEEWAAERTLSFLTCSSLKFLLASFSSLVGVCDFPVSNTATIPCCHIFLTVEET